MKFKLGQRVKILKGYFKNSCGKIERLVDDCLFVRIDNHFELYEFNRSDLEPLFNVGMRVICNYGNFIDRTGTIVGIMHYGINVLLDFGAAILINEMHLERLEENIGITVEMDK